MNEVANELREIVEAFYPRLEAISADSHLAVRPRPEKWSRKEILGHLIDSACNNQQKFVRMMQNSHLKFPGYAQDDWVAVQDYAQADWENMLGLWKFYNLHIAYLIATVKQELLSNTVEIEGVGPFTLEFVMPDYVEHLKHHLKQIFPDADLENRFVNVYGA